METMKAVQIHSYGGPEVLVYEEVPRPEPSSKEVLIRVQAASVNPLDWKIRQGYMQDMMPVSLPLILGLDIAGVVEAIGSDVNTISVGQDVYAAVSDMLHFGGYADYAVRSVEYVAPKPKTLDYIQAASVPVVAATAWQGLFDVGNLAQEQKVLVHAAAGGVGMFAVQLAKVHGAYVIGTASTRNIDFVKSLGADEVIDYTTTPFEKVVRDVDIVLDTLGGDTQARSWGVLKPGGILVATATFPSQEVAAQHSVRAAMVLVNPTATVLTKIAELIDAGKLRTLVDTVLPLAEARRAHELSQQGHTRGKIILEVQPS
ncbi:NADP-dependent oxidoreductase [Aetokthonos hydrillicola Thurmond2011]|jgi:NADPH:quinone reductase-like Zn-dependent oxidoreductase|uniref:NADP-dependent oxidoreductase n=1 Tax=Aetokthonos hydrillicola Thurmond2011 TaxID=2712845 RepID=A0AAP5I1Q2_9CYAN|nr:NADP-dependent oxidoreductase [Aetokthonos hydrillicola]MBW4586542.1 NADP-dependent oxidoreductase [Aetokthonos hydrillicola CCALA 1050]MDR9893513.1 NADP-dependent oxidoreductase [Aetokthonos hydrillicola Thurmond2011]